jgi:DNA-binding response OmpR family regulator
VGDARSTVLVVDDDASIRLLCRVNLELEGYRVFEAASLGQARALIDSERVDCMLLDLHVGNEHGYALLDELRASEQDIGIALLTGSSKIDDDRRVEVHAVLPKPFTLEQLTETAELLTKRNTDVESHIV